MKKAIVKQDIFNEHGILLIAKGTEIDLTDDKIILLNKIGKLEELLHPLDKAEDESSDTSIGNMEEETKLIFEKRIEEIVRCHTTIDLEVLKKSTDVINSILFGCKKKEWYRYIILLHSYVDWLYEHSINTAIISYLIGNALGYDEKRLYYLCIGALLHDIGMTLLPKKILEKPTVLTDVEYQIVKNHSEMGYALISGFHLPENCKKIIWQHHERMDGSGYPNGLKREEIMEESLIVMVAEYFDTATTKRSYKSAEKAGNVLKRMDLAKNLLPNDIVKIIRGMLKENCT